jgi:hypothetical protein
LTMASTASVVMSSVMIWICAIMSGLNKKHLHKMLW